ncbi:MAG: hypothetical protein WKG03_07915 [Telluria sp.]
MRRQHPDRQRDIPISLQVHHQLLGASINTGFEKEDWEIAAEAIDEWVRRHDPDALSTPAHSGYQWKRLFLPDGTVLRTVFNGKNSHCVVEGDRIVFNGKHVSPSGFVNAVGGIRRNAWRCTWILFPETKQWQLADALRPQRPRRPRTHTRPTLLTPAMPPVPASGPACALPVSDPSAASPFPVAANPTEAPCLHKTIRPPAPHSPSHGRTHDRQPPTDFPLAPPRCVRGTDRRSNGDDRMAALLRQ